jgi:hypothetical protein
MVEIEKPGKIIDQNFVQKFNRGTRTQTYDRELQRPSCKNVQRLVHFENKNIFCNLIKTI